ncbi:MAG: protease family protein, partial [Actinomycetota bacterium]|nr:protease family protein [Actinomycetota bacterium]
VLIYAIGGYSIGDTLPLWVTALAEIPLWVGLVGAALLATKRKGTGSLRADFGLAMRPSDVPLGLVAGFVGQIGIVLVVTPIYRLLGVDTNKVGATARDLADRAVHTPDVVLLVAVVVIGAPVIEELFYRGLVLRSIERRWGTGFAVVATSVTFAVLHFQPYDLLPLTLFGLIASTLAARTGRLGPGIWAHVAFNLTAVVSLLASSR